MSPEDLIRDCIRGDSTAWELLVSHLEQTVWSVAWYYVGSSGGRSAAEDVYQETFLRLLANDYALLRRFDPHLSSLNRYVAIVTRSCALNSLRKRKHEPLSFHPDPLSLVPDSMDADVACNPDDEWEIAGAFSSLSKREQEILTLIYRKQLDCKEVSRELKISEATVRSTKAHALKKLHDFLK
jgi:RNA polymerase sigma-70 factor (ECF subfamily)